MLHLQVVNLERLTFESLTVPPALLPQALAAAQSSGSMAQAGDDLEKAAQELKTLASGSIDRLLGKPTAHKQLFTAPGQKNQIRAFSIPLTFRPDYKKGSLETDQRLGRGRARPGHQGPVQALFHHRPGPELQALRSRTPGLGHLPEQRPAPGKHPRVRIHQGPGAFSPGPGPTASAFLIFEPGKVKGVSLKTLGQFKEVEITPGLDALTHILAVSGDDVSFIDIRPRGDISPENINQVRRSKTKIKALRGFIFTERGVYRPGDTVHYKGAIRQYRDDRITTPEASTAHLTILDPKGAAVLDQDLPVSEFGTLWGDLETKPYFSLGTYTMTLRYGQGENQEISRTFQVQEFRPPRHYAEIGF